MTLQTEIRQAEIDGAEIKMWQSDRYKLGYPPDYHAFDAADGRWHIHRYVDGTWSARFTKAMSLP